MEENTIRIEAINFIEEQVKEALDDVSIGEQDNLIEKGLTSIMIMNISNKLRKFKIKLSFAMLMEKPTICEWKNLIMNASIELGKNKELINTKSNSNEEFPLTDVQYAYWIGREDDQVLGGVSCHAYLEFDGENIDTCRLRESWNSLQNSNPMLRARFTKKGTQQIMEKPFSNEIGIYDFHLLNEDDIKIKLIDIREKLSHRKLQVELGEVAGLNIAILPDNKHRLFLDVDLLVADVMSLSILIDELSRIYNQDIKPMLPTYTFKNYLKNKEVDEKTSKEDEEFWKNKILSFPKETPNLPLNKKLELIKKPVFSRRKKVVDKLSWSKIKDKSARYKVTPAMVLLACYSLVIERWINQEKFVINMPIFNRNMENKDAGNMIADFTNILLIECESKINETILDRIKKVGETFLENVAHSSYSGVKVQRDIYKEVGRSNNIAPIIFACNIEHSMETETSRSILGKITYMITQTPQVWLDFQTYIEEGNLVLCWDAIDELYPEEMIDDMFLALNEIIQFISNNDNWDVLYDILPKKQKDIRKQELDAIIPLKYNNKTLHADFIELAKLNSDYIAIIDAETGKKITYGELYNEALKLAGKLIEVGVKKGDYVGITLPRGYLQIIGLLGILFAGAVYVPIGINQPKERREKIYQQIGISHIVSDNNMEEEEKIICVDIEKTDNNIILSLPVDVEPYDSAYVIMTSGTTGIPKGVEICHNSAMNTIIDINEKNDISSKDTIIMVSAIDFDLSVYDIFGMLSVGGTIIALNENNFKNPDLWIDLIEKYSVTLWDSVPILFDMLVTMAEGKNVNLPIKVVLLSGDWIGINLPKRFYEISNNSVVVAMGGATEASIWSNYINVPKDLPENWISIPYGKALKNQIYRIVDDFGRICPNYVMGELLIGGVGLAKGYRGDNDLTSKKFIYKDNFRWYKTGDNGRTWNDGTIEFLGRRDSQVKVKGHRIELGEIEDAIKKYPGIKNAIVDVIQIGINGQLTAFLEHEKNTNIALSKEELKLKKQIYDTSIEYNDCSSYLNKLNHLIVTFILNIFRSKDIFSDGDDKEYTLFEIVSKGKFINDYNTLILRWLNILVDCNILAKNGEKFSFNHEKQQGRKVFLEDDKINSILDKLKFEIMEVLQGKKNAIEVFYSEKLDLKPTDFLSKLKNYNENITRILDVMQKINENKNEKIKILEIGGRDSRLTNLILDLFEDRVNEYVYCDNSEFFKEDFKETELKYGNFKYRKIDSEDNLSLAFGNDKYDLVLLYNSLHRFKDFPRKIMEIKNILNFGGFIVGSEIDYRNLIPEISASILEKGFENYNLESVSKSIIPSVDTIKDAFSENSLKQIYVSDYKEVERLGNLLFAVKNEDIAFSQQKLRIFLKNKLPIYMIPIFYVDIYKMPLNKNGKVDRKKLKENAVSGKDNSILNNIIISKTNADKEEQIDDMTITLIKIWKEVLNKENIGVNSNYFHIGGDSLLATRLVFKIQMYFDIEISIASIFEHPVLADLSKYIKEKESERKNIKSTNTIEPDPENENVPFLLTDVQFAYWIGRSGAYSLGNVSTHCYFELDCLNIDIGRLQTAINNMINEHGMLRSVILNNGEQCILKKTPPYILNICDISVFDESLKEKILIDIRKKMSHEIIETNKWPLFNFKVTIINKEQIRFHVSFDNIILDGWSMFHILEELKQRYDDESFSLFNIKVSFRDYVLALNKMKKTSRYEKDKEYWLSRLENFSDSPKFAFTKSELEVENQLFNRREKYIMHNDWERLKLIARQNNITPTVLLITMFSETLRKYTINQDFVLNITQFNREQIHPDINKIVGDFTTLTLLEVKTTQGNTIIERAKVLQKQLLDDMNHSLYSAVEFGRELRSIINNDKESLMPIVFTSALGINQSAEKGWLGKLVYNISQTPQVWLDHQVIEEEGKLKLIWDSVDEIFPQGLLDNMFNDYVSSIESLANNPQIIVEKIKVDNDSKSLRYFDKKNTNISKVDSKKTYGNNAKKLTSIYETDEFRILLNNMTEIWKKILNIEFIEREDNFFSLGGNSLNMIQLSNILIEKYNYHMDMSEFMENSNVEYIVKSIINYKTDINS